MINLNLSKFKLFKQIIEALDQFQRQEKNIQIVIMINLNNS